MKLIQTVGVIPADAGIQVVSDRRLDDPGKTKNEENETDEIGYLPGFGGLVSTEPNGRS